MMLLDAFALVMLGLMSAIALRLDRAKRLAVTILMSGAGLFAWFWAGAPPGMGLSAVLAFVLACALSAPARAKSPAPIISGAAAAGLFTLSGPVGAITAGTAIVLTALAQPRDRAYGFVRAGIMLFVPLVIVISLGTAAWIETGDVMNIRPGPAPFLRGPAPAAGDAVFALPVLLVFALLARSGQVRVAFGALAVAAGGFAACMVMDSVAPFLPIAAGASIAAARRSGLNLMMALILLGLTLKLSEGRAALFVPSVAFWQIDAAPSSERPAWGASAGFSAAHPHDIPVLVLEKGRYKLVPP